MSYLVLARKWRPQVFEEVVGQRRITQTLQNAISQKRVAHAFLFTGARGVGKTSTARILAKALNCEKGSQINPCNHCSACQEISHGTSMDVIEIDGASNRGIDEIRELRDNVRYTPAKGRYKVYIIDEVHMLTREAFNALLKTLEEPPPHIIFIFATTEPHKIPTTILSRCQRYDFKKIPLKEVVESLRRIIEEEQVQVSQRGLFLIAHASEGSMRDAQSLLDQVISYGGKDIRDEDIAEVLGLIDRKILYDTVDAIAGNDAGRCAEVVEQLYQSGYDLQNFCRELLQHFRNLIVTQVSLRPEELIELPGEELDALKKQGEKFQFDQLNHLFSLLLKGEEEIAQSTFPRTMLEMVLIRMATLPSVLPIDAILKRLEGLEKPTSSARSLESIKPLLPDQTANPEESETEDEISEEGQPLREMTLHETAPSSMEPVSPENPERGEEAGGESSKIREETWRGLVDFTRARNPVLGAFLALGNLVHVNGEKIEISFEKDSFHYERIVEKENRGLLGSICHEYFQRDVQVIISPLEQTTRAKERMVSEAGPALNGTANGTDENPVIQEALRLFNGRIVQG